MAISFACTGCGATYNVPDTLAGKKAQCKKCGVSTRIPSPPTAEKELGFRDDAPGTARGSSTQPASGSKSQADASDAPDLSHLDDLAPATPARGPAKKGTAQPPLSPLPKVAMSELDALDLHSDGGERGHGGKGPGARNFAPPESYSLLLILSCLGMIGLAVYLGYKNWPSTLPPIAPEAATAGDQPHLLILVPRLLAGIAAFAVLGPLMALGWFGACKAFNVRLPNSLYLRSVGLATMPVIIIGLLTALPLGIDLSIASLVALLSLPAAFALLHYVHRQSMNIAGAATGAGGLLVAIGLLLTYKGSSAAEDSLRAAFLQKREAFVQQKVTETKQKEIAAKEESQQKAIAEIAATQSLAMAEAASKEATALLAQLKALQDKQSLATQTRESLAVAVNRVETDFAAVKAKASDRPEYAPITEAIASLRQTADKLPSEKPPADITQAIDAKTDWTDKSAGREISIYGYNFIPPAGAAVALDADPKESGWRWKSPDGQAELQIMEIAAADPTQKRPWVVPAYAAKGSSNLFTVDAPLDAKVETGLIAGAPFTKITAPDAGLGATRRLTYATLSNGKWLAVSLRSTSQNVSAMDEMDRAVRSIHKRPDGVAVTDPLSVTELVARYRTTPREQQVIIDLVKNKPGIEDTVLRLMGVTPDAATLQQFGPLVASVATDHSVPTLWKIAALEGGASDVARTTLKKLDPKKADDLSFAIMDLNNGHRDQVKQAITYLSAAPYQKPRAVDVGNALLVADASCDLSITSNGPELEQALGRWMNDKIAAGLVKMLEDPSSAKRKLAIKALAATGNAKNANSISRCVLLEPDLVVETLIAMGPAAEPDVLRLLGEPPPLAKKCSAMILQEIGTSRSAGPLQAAVGLSHDPEFKAAGQAALARIKERAKAPASQPGK